MVTPPPPPLPGGYQMGEMLYFTGYSETFDDGNRLVHGQQGEVVGPDLSEQDRRIKMRFAGNTGVIGCLLLTLSRDPPPPLPGGYQLGDMVQYLGSGRTYDDGDRLTHGQQGEVMGPSIKYGGSLRIKFPINKRNISCVLPSLSRSPPPPVEVIESRPRVEARL